MKNCDIVKDLLPNYIENLTSTDTNSFIENHLKECKECKDLFNTMNQEITDNIKIDKEILESKDVKFLKNINKKMLKKALVLGIIIGIALLIIIYICIVVYRFIIIENLSNKYSSFQQSNNIYLEVNDNYLAEDFSFTENLKTQYWYKDNIIKVQQSSTKYDVYTSYIRYIDLEKNIIYIFNYADNTVKILDKQNTTDNNEIFLTLNSKYKNNLSDKLELSLSIYTPVYNKDNYYIINEVGNNIYDSKTGLLNISYYHEYTGNETNPYNNHYQTYTYSINSVTDSDILMPNIDNYTLIK